MDATGWMCGEGVLRGHSGSGSCRIQSSDIAATQMTFSGAPSAVHPSHPAITEGMASGRVCMHANTCQQTGYKNALNALEVCIHGEAV